MIFFLTHPTPRGLLYVVRSFVPSFVRSFVSRQCWPRSGQNGTTTHDRARPTTHDHARPHTITHDRPRTHDRARPRTTTHDHALPRTTTHDRARSTAHDRPRLPYLFEEAVPTPPQGGLNCLARLALARERTPS